MAGPGQATEIMSGEKDAQGRPKARAVVEPIDSALKVQNVATISDRQLNEQILAEQKTTNELLLAILEKL